MLVKEVVVCEDRIEINQILPLKEEGGNERLTRNARLSCSRLGRPPGSQSV